MGAAVPYRDIAQPVSPGWKESWQQHAGSYHVRAGPGCSRIHRQPGQRTPDWFGRVACSSMGMQWRRGAALTEIYEIKNPCICN